MVKRYNTQTRQFRVGYTRVPYRNRTKSTRKLTNAEKRERSKTFNEKKDTKVELLKGAHAVIWKEAVKLSEKLGNTPAYWYEYLMHTDATPAVARSTNLWCVYLSMRSKELNAEVASGAHKLTPPEISQMIKDKWNQMSKEQKAAVVADTTSEVEARRTSKQLGSHNVPIASFHDFRKTMDSINEQLLQLKQHTGVEALVIACRTSPDSFIRPHSYATGDLPAQFFDTVFNRALFDVAVKMEAYTLLGVDGIRWSHFEEVARKRAQCADIILQKLQEAGRPANIKKMYYADFEKQITKKYALVCEHWPLPVFQSPHHLNTLDELNVLYNAWKNEVSVFRKLTAVEHSTWLQTYEAALTAKPSETLTLRTDCEDAPHMEPIITPLTVDGITRGSSSSQDAPIQPQAPVIPSVTTIEMTTGETTVARSRGKKRKVPDQLVFSVDGEPVKQKARRSDYGKKRGPYKKKTPQSGPSRTSQGGSGVSM